MNNNSEERTLSIIKPDAVERELEAKIKELFIKNNQLKPKALSILKDFVPVVFVFFGLSNGFKG